MEKVLEIVAIIQAALVQAGPVVAAVNGVLAALIALALLIPGDQPEKFLQSVVDFLAKISKK